MSGIDNTSVPAIAAPAAAADSLVPRSAVSARTILGPAQPRPVTLKSSYNKLADRTLA